MDGKRFDYLTRRVGLQANRRTLLRTGMGGTLALLGLGGVTGQSEARNRRNHRSSRTGFENDSCASNGDCREGLQCRGAKTGVAPGFPTPIEIPVITGKEGTCKYKKGCGGERGDACRRNDDCCDDLTCDNNRCRRR